MFESVTISHIDGIPRIFVSSRARRVSLSVSRDGKVRFVMPRGYSRAKAEKFFRDSRSWLESKLKSAKSFKRFTVPARDRKEHYRAHKEAARKIINERLIVLNEPYGFRYKRIAVKNQKTRWGSCSRKGNLCFNYKIIFLPDSLRDYVIVHELCHLGEFNHSKKFWNLVACTVPNWRILRGELHTYEL